jgi:hypothetical protein
MKIAAALLPRVCAFCQAQDEACVCRFVKLIRKDHALKGYGIKGGEIGLSTIFFLFLSSIAPQIMIIVSYSASYYPRALNEILSLERVERISKLAEFVAVLNVKEAGFKQAPLLAEAKV